MTEHQGNGRGPTWRIVAGVSAILLLAVVSFLLGSVFTRLNKHDVDLQAQQSRLGDQATKQAVQDYRLQITEGIVAEVRADVKAIRELVERRR